ncbi:MAG: type IX secretion system membrane protein PorP/SprF [Crocinitomicaceae bacterium]|jgi:type IX secretion system PorP/SprF family membrane protein|tara:strand:- start:108 stop:1757 length:1650 start_codon:yes stop_codon:yes gene_type:complete
MTSPNFENIDLWLFDYIEGNLSTYQKELLEGYLLNHPELEVDLDSWKMSTLPLSDNFVNDIHINKKKENRYAYYFTTFLGAAIILLIGQSDHLQFTINDTESKIYQSNNKQDFTDNVTPFTIIGTSTPSKNKTSSPLEHKGNHNNIIHQDVIPIYIAVANEEVTGENNMTFAEGTQLFASGNHLISIQLSPIKLPYQSTGQLSFKNSEFIDLAFTDERKIKKEHSLSGFMLKTKEIFNKLDRVLSKSIALSNYRDHYYMIPGISSSNAHLSSTGSVSQTRFFSTSRVRWLESEQQKLSQEFTIDGYARSIKSGIGAQVSYDTYASGTIKDWNAALTFSPKIALSRNISLEPVAKLKIGNKILNAEKVNNNSVSLFNSASPQIFSFDTTQEIGRKLWYRDLDAGATLNTKVFYVGFQAENILNHVENLYQNEQNSNYRIPTTYSVFAGTQYVSRNEKISFHPYLYFRSSEKINSYYAGFSFDLDKLFIGGSYGSAEQYSASIGLSLDQFAVLLQSTRAYQPILNQQLFTHQLTLRFNTPMSKKTRRYITL